MSRRPSLRSNVTTLGRKLERLLTEDPLDASELKVTIAQLQDKAARLAAMDEEVQQKLEEDLAEDPAELDDKMTDEMHTSETYKDNVARWVTLGKEALTASTPQPSNGGSSSSSAEGSSTPSNGNQPEIRMTTAAASFFRLPEFRLPRFNGQDILRFPSYFDQFQSLVHQNPSITDVQRFCLLKESLSGTPLSLVDGLMVTSENYAKALELLDEAYNDPNLLLGIFVSRLHTQPMVKDPKSHLLQKLISQFEQSFQEIQNLIRRLQIGTGTLSQQDGGLAIVEYFLTPHLLSKIPEEIQISWYNRNSEPQARFSFSGLLAFLKEHVRSRQACRLLTGGSQPNHDIGNKFWQQNSSRGRPHSVTAALLTDQEKRCPKCRQDHRLFACPAFQKMETQLKWDSIKAQKRCYNCFSNLHGIQDCPSKFTCRYCHKRHHSLLCKNKPASVLNATAQTFFPKPQAPPKGRFTASERNASSAPSTSSLYAGTGINENSEQTVPRTTESFLSEPQQETKAFLQIIKLKISNPSNGKEATVHALFDSGASQTWVKQDLAAELGLKIQQKTQFKVQSFGAQSSQINSYKVDFNLKSLDGSSGLLPCTAYTAKAITGLMDQYKPTNFPSHLQGLDLSNTPAYKNSTVYPAILIGAQHYWDFLTGEIIKGQPTAVRTVFGWCISGPTSKTQVNEVSSTQVFVSAHVQKIWDLCSLGITERPHEVKELVTPIIKEGRYEVNLPFKSNARPGSNYENALQRSLALERKLSDEEVEQYDQYFEAAKKEGIIVQLEEANESQGYFLPFHGVKKNEKLRIVFDGSSKDRRTNSSLNDTLHAGENTFNQLYDVFIRFRQFEHPTVGDITKAFHQIAVAPADRQWMKFTWKGITYSFARVPFGLASSSYLLHICLQHRFKSLKDERLSELLLRGNYVDDFPLSFVTTEKREEFRQKAAQTLATVKMTLTEEVKSNKVLGISWERERDQFLFDLTALAQPKKFTKRELLRCLASVFDPLGILNPFVMRLKVLFQHTWTLSLKWDDPVPAEVKETWKKWLDEARSLVIRIPRWIGLNTKDWTLVCFTDASSSSLGITLYCVLEGESSHLLASKFRLCPLNPTTLTIPRAELVALLLGIRMINRFVSEMKPSAQIYLYTDSETCIRWINSPPPRSETFLFNRIREIHGKRLCVKDDFTSSLDPAKVTALINGQEDVIAYLSPGPALSLHKEPSKALDQVVSHLLRKRRPGTPMILIEIAPVHHWGEKDQRIEVLNRQLQRWSTSSRVFYHANPTIRRRLPEDLTKVSAVMMQKSTRIQNFIRLVCIAKRVIPSDTIPIGPGTTTSKSSAVDNAPAQPMLMAKLIPAEQIPDTPPPRQSRKRKNLAASLRNESDVTPKRRKSIVDQSMEDPVPFPSPPDFLKEILSDANAQAACESDSYFQELTQRAPRTKILQPKKLQLESVVLIPPTHPPVMREYFTSGSDDSPEEDDPITF